MHGRWHVHQQNGYNPIFDVHVHGDHIHGTASLDAAEGLRAGYAGAVTQALEGHFHPHGEVHIRIVWPAKRDGSHAIGNYTGHFHQDHLHGTCFDELDPRHPGAEWHAERC